jgi:hypothetical protein
MIKLLSLCQKREREAQEAKLAEMRAQQDQSQRLKEAIHTKESLQKKAAQEQAALEKAKAE